MGTADQAKTKAQLISELEGLRRRLRKLDRTQAAKPGQKPSLPAAAPPGSAPERTPARVLVVDDSRVVRDALRLELEKAGHQPILAASGPDGLKKLDPDVDLVLLDLRLPGLDGLEVLKRIRANPATRPIPVIMLTALSELENRIEAFAAGADDYLLKPYHPTELLVTINRILERKRVEKELRESEERFRVMAEVAVFPMALIDAQGTYLFLNPKFTEVFGYDRSELPTGREWFRKAFPNQADRREAIAAWIDDLEKTGRGEIRQRSFRVRAKDGSEKDIVFRPVSLADGRQLVVYEDITERKQADEALRQANQKLASVFRALPDLFFHLNRDGVILDFKAGRSVDLYLPPDRFIGQRAQAVLPPEVGAKIEAAIRQTAQEETVMIEYELPLPAGARTFEARFLSPVGDDIFAIVRDITEAKAGERLSRVQRDLAIALSGQNRLEDILNLCLEAALQVSGLDSGGIYLVDEVTGALDLRCHRGLSPDFIRKKSHLDADSPNAQLVRPGRPLYSEYLNLDVPKNEVEQGEGLRAIAVIPVLHHGRVIACFNIASHSINDISPGARLALETVSGQMGVAVARAKTAAALRESEEKYRELVENANSIILRMDSEGKVAFFNEFAQSFFGFSADEILGRSVVGTIVPATDSSGRDLAEMIREIGRDPGPYQNNENENMRRGGERVWVAWTNRALVDHQGRLTEILCIGNDITKRKRTEDALRMSEQRQLLSINVLKLLNQAGEKVDLIRELLLLIKGATKLEAVAIRLKEGDDYPYYLANGFSEDFVEAERYLCARDHNGEIIRDLEGSPCLECMCGNILCARFDPSLPFFTDGGSFWSNCTTELLATTTENDRQARTRNRCNGEGYESVALVPLRVGEEIIGLLQFNDRRPRQFTLELIRFFEGLGASMGIALERKRAEDAIAASEAQFRSLVESSADHIFMLDLEGNFLSSNNKSQELPSGSALIGKNLREIHSPEVAEYYLEQFREVVSSKKPVSFEHWIDTSEGRKYHIDTLFPIIQDEQLMSVGGICHDINERKRAEAALQTSEERYRIITENMGDMVWLTDMNFITTYISPSLVRSRGFTLEELQALPLEENFSPASMQIVSEAMAEELTPEKLGQKDLKIERTLELEFGRKDGSFFWCEATLTLIRDGEGKPRGIVGVGRDIAERKRAEDALKESERRLAEIINFLPVATFVVDREGKITAWNHALELMTGVNAREMLGKGNQEYALPFYGERRAIFIDLVHAPRQEIERQYQHVEKYENYMIGETFLPKLGQNGINVIVYASELRDSQGRRAGAIESIMDITKRKRAEQILLTEQAETLRLNTLLENVVDNMTSGLLVTDDHGKIIIINHIAQKIFGATQEKAVGRPITDLSPDLTVFVDLILPTMMGQEVCVTRADGSEIPLGFTSTYLKDSEDRITGVVTVFKDLTDIKEIHRELREREKMATIGELAGGIAHEIKNPIFAISSGVQVLESELELDGEQKAAFKSIFNETMRVDRLIRQLLLYSRPKELKRGSIQLAELIAEVVSLNQGLAKVKNIALLKSIDEPMPWLFGDRDKLTQVFMNILQNAIEISDPGSAIEIAVGMDESKRHALIEIKDRGPGIPEKHRERIFDLFFSTKKGSSGLGLAISQKMIKEHGGDIHAEPRAGGGTVFVIEIPLEGKP